jgi:hypothetical protein
MHLKSRCNPLLTITHFPREYNFPYFGLAFWAFELDFILEVIGIEPRWRLEEIRIAIVVCAMKVCCE